MVYRNPHVPARALIALDAIAVALATPLLMALDVPVRAWAERQPGSAVLLTLSLTACFVLVAKRLGLYHTHRTDRLRHELGHMLEAAVLAIGVCCLLVESLTAGFSGAVYAAVGATSTGLLLGARILLRLVVRHLRQRGRDVRRWLLVGRNVRTAEIAQDILANTHYGVQIVGVLDVAARRAPLAAGDPQRLFERSPLSSLPLMTEEPIPFIEHQILHHGLDEVIVALPLRSFYDEVTDIVRLCIDAGVGVKVPVQAIPSHGTRAEVVDLGAQQLVTHVRPPPSEHALAAKRLLDVALSSVALVLASPALLAIALAVKLGSPGPVLFRQRRVGLGGKPFTMYKFRSMECTAEARLQELRTFNEVDGPVFKIRDDPRVTPVGRFLRRYHLDELPQLVNVLAGHMSLVGPRPPLPEETFLYEPWQRRRLTMPQGLTCLWQLKQDREIPFSRWMELDLQYIDRWSLALDVRILMATFGAVMRGKGW